MRPPPSPGPLSRTIERFPDVSLNDKVALNQKCILRIAVTEHPVRKDVEDIKALIIKVEKEPPIIDVLVTAQDFDIIGGGHHSLVVPLDRDSDPILVYMMPQKIGEKRVRVEFFQDSRYIGGVTAKTTVMTPTEITHAELVHTQGVIGLEQGALGPDLTIIIDENESDNRHLEYKFTLHSPKNNLCYYEIDEPMTPEREPSLWWEDFYEELENLKATEDPENIKETLSSKGSDLYEKLFPRELKEIWENQIRGKVKSIMIISEEPWIPWEIIKPSYKTETGEPKEDGFLCETYFLTRWIRGPTPPSVIKISQSALIAPAGSELPSVQQEATFLMTCLKNMVEIEPTLKSVRKLLKEGGFHLIHFACHGKFDPEAHEQSIVFLQGNDKLKSRDISGERMKFLRDKPFVFINACQTARGDFSLVGIGSWAREFINKESSSSGFIGASWEVDDKLAYVFSTTFYSSLLQGKTIGEAMRIARLKIKDEPDPTWLAYALYADPRARVYFA